MGPRELPRRHPRLYILKSTATSLELLDYTGRNPQNSSNHLVQQDDGGTVVSPAKLWAGTQMGHTDLVGWLFGRSMNLRVKDPLPLFFPWKEKKSICYPKQDMQGFPCSHFSNNLRGLGGCLSIINVNRQVYNSIWYWPLDPKFKLPALIASKEVKTNHYQGLPKVKPLSLGH